MTISKHIAVFPFPYGTHAAPILHLVRMLANSTPSIRFSFFTTAKSKLSLFSGQDSGNIWAYEISDGLPEGFVSTGEVEKLAEYFLKAAPESFKNGVEAAEADAGEKVSGLLTDAFLWFSGEMAAAMGVPWVAFWTAGPGSISAQLYTDLIKSIYKENGAGAGVGKNGEINLKFIPGMSEIRMSDLPQGAFSSDVESTFASMIDKMVLVLPKARAVVINSFEELDPVITNDLKTKLQNVLSIGPSLLSFPPPSKPDESGCLTWLDTQKDKSVAYISFGTICTPPPHELSALATALEDSGTPFLWSLRDNNKSLLPEGFLERTSSTGKVVAWAPQLQVLAHASVGIFVTHCGWNSVLEGISYGVPMIGRPFFGDQMMNCAMVQNVWKIGMRVEGGVFTKTGTMKAIQILSSKEKGKEMRENVSVLKENAIKAVDLGGSSTKNYKTLIDVIVS